MPELPINPQQMAELMKLAGTGAGRKLLNLLQREKGDALKKALNAGNFEEAKALVRDFMNHPEAKELLRQLGR